jgi:hypothetical protein
MITISLSSKVWIEATADGKRVEVSGKAYVDRSPARSTLCKAVDAATTTELISSKFSCASCASVLNSLNRFRLFFCYPFANFERTNVPHSGGPEL